MQKVKLTLEVDLAEVLSQVANAVEMQREEIVFKSPTLPVPRKVHVVGSTRKHSNQHGSTDRTMLAEAIKTVLGESEVPLLPKAVRERILEDNRFKTLLKGERVGLVATTMYWMGKGQNPKLERVADGYIIKETFSEEGVAV